MGQPGTNVGELCAELGVTRQTLYRHVDPQGALRADGEKLLRQGGRKERSEARRAAAPA
jgi:transposase-like protein